MLKSYSAKKKWMKIYQGKIRGETDDHFKKVGSFENSGRLVVGHILGI
jgi:hypothetical protein